MNSDVEEARDPGSRGEIFTYFGSLTLLIYLVLPHGYLLDIATTYMLKNQLSSSASDVAQFRLLTALPLYVSFLFGLMRDLWRPFGARDPAYLVIFSLVTAAVYLWLAFTPLTFTRLFWGTLGAMMSFRLVIAAYMGLLALVAQEKMLSGRLSALWNSFGTLPYIAGALGAGFLVEKLLPRQTFLTVAALLACICLCALWRPRAVFAGTYEKPQAQKQGGLADIGRLLRHKPIYPVVLILFLFQFAPGADTPLQFYLSDVVHASDAVYAYYFAIFSIAFLPAVFLYGYVCKRAPLRVLLWCGALVTVPQMIPLAFIHTANLALLMAVPIGLMGGFAATAYYDLAMRSCPPGLQGSLMMLIDGVYMLSDRSGDVVGAWLYGQSPTNGFSYCVIASTVTYLLIIPVLRWIPREIVSAREGEPMGAA